MDALFDFEIVINHSFQEHCTLLYQKAIFCCLWKINALKNFFFSFILEFSKGKN